MTMSMMGVETNSLEEVISVVKMDAPAGTYDNIETYTKIKSYNPFEQKK